MEFEFGDVDATENDDGNYSLRHDEFVVPPVKAVQEQQMINELKKENQIIKSQR